jgi:hypothetical protein
VIEHVADDSLAAVKWCALKPVGDRVILPEPLVSGRQHGHYWRGEYHFGNTPLINYLPDRWRNQLAPHVRTYTARGIRRLFDDQPVKIVHHTRIFGGYDNIVYRYPRLGRWLRGTLYAFEDTPLRVVGLSHLVVIEKVRD